MPPLPAAPPHVRCTGCRFSKSDPVAAPVALLQHGLQAAALQDHSPRPLSRLPSVSGARNYQGGTRAMGDVEGDGPDGGRGGRARGGVMKMALPR